jgi:ABC-type Na+ efflux pump permease subunit
MKLSFREAEARLNVLSLIPLNKVNQTTRVKIVRCQVAIEKVINQVQEDINSGLKKIKKEGFDERFQKYEAAINPQEGKESQAELQRNLEGYEEFKKEYDELNSEYQELQQKAIADKINVNYPEFDDANLENIVTILPAGETTEIIRDGKTIAVSNDEIVKAVVAYFVA